MAVTLNGRSSIVVQRSRSRLCVGRGSRGRPPLSLGLLLCGVVVVGSLLPSPCATVKGLVCWPFRATASSGSAAARATRRLLQKKAYSAPLTQLKQSALLGSQEAVGSGVLAIGKVTTAEHLGELEDLLVSLKKDGGDAVVQLAAAWNVNMKKFWKDFDAFAQVYTKTRFVKFVDKEANDGHILRLAGDVLPVGPSSIFLAYSKGRLVSQWTGTDSERFKTYLESSLSSANQVATARRATEKSSGNVKFPSGHDVAAEAEPLVA